ncbi:MAG TPA: response regulator transcription factor [Rhodothermales bacterium]|nr:response regulator transcription factor [Rhodothermales bacterium]
MPDFKILLVDDEPDLLELVRYNLIRDGYTVFTAANGEQALKVAAEVRPHLVVLDVRMPVLDGIETCKRLRDNRDTADLPVIMLTALSQEIDEVKGLGAGADDYIAKPVSYRKLEARIKSLLRRAYPEVEQEAVLRREGIEIDREKYLVRRTVQGEEQKLHLPKKQFELLYALASKPGVVQSREELLDEVWGEDVYVTPRTVDVHVRKIRDTIGEHYIETVKGVGYRFAE